MSFNYDRCKNILVLMTDKHMGNLVVSLSAIASLKEFFKEKNFFLVIDKSYAEIVESMIASGNLILFPRKEIKKSNLIKQAGIFLNFLCKVRRTSPDIAIDLEGRHLSSTMTFLSGASVRIGSSSSERPYFYNHKVVLSKGKHKAYNYGEIARAAGASNEGSNYIPRASDAWKNSLQKILESEGTTGSRPIACIHPGAGKIYKQWTLEGFALISDWLFSKGLNVIFIGSRHESEKIKEIMSHMQNRSYNLSEKLTLGALIALFELSSIYIGNDSGPMHIAEATGTPVIALFGPADEKRWGPLSAKSVVLRGENPCKKCMGKDCTYDFKCVKTLKVADVQAAAEILLGSAPGIKG